MTLVTDNTAAAKVIGLWWGLSLIFVRALLEIQFLAPLLEAVRLAVPAARKYAHASGFEAATTGFYCFFVISTPFVAAFYFRFMMLKRPMSRGAKLIMWFLVPLAAFFMTIGVDFGPSDSSGFLSMFNTVLTSSWFGSSLVFLLFCHCLLSAVVCIAKDQSKDFS